MALWNLTSVCKTSRPASCIWGNIVHLGDTQAGTALRRDSGGPAGEVGELNPALKVFSKAARPYLEKQYLLSPLRPAQGLGEKALLQCRPLLTLPISDP